MFGPYGLASHQIARGVLKPFTRAKQGRHDRAYRHANDLRDLFVGQTFSFAEQEYFPKTIGQLPHGPFEQLCVRALERQGFRIEGARCFGMYLFITLGGDLPRAVLLPPPQSRGADDGEQPGTRIPAPEGAKVSKSLQACLLNNIFRLVSAPHEPPCEVVSRIEMRKDHLVKTVSRCRCVYHRFGVHAVEFALLRHGSQWLANPRWVGRASSGNSLISRRLLDRLPGRCVRLQW